jgi:hypothetical protein
MTNVASSLRRVKVVHTVVWQWLARYNKLIFGSIYLFGVAVTFARWISV